MTGGTEAEIREFCRLDADRFGIIKGFLNRNEVDASVIETGGLRHFLIRPGADRAFTSGEYVKTLTAHYDRYPGSPGANDNGAAVMQLLDLASYLSRADYPHNCQILLTDGEEIRRGGDSSSQGSYRLARLFREKGFTKTAVVILDMCGLGDTMVYSTGNEKLTGSLSPREKSVLGPILELIPTYARGRSLNHIERFSDDLGFLHHDFLTLQISLIPWKEREILREDKIPPSWQTMHTRNDSADRLEKYSFRIMEGFLKALSKVIITD